MSVDFDLANVPFPAADSVVRDENGREWHLTPLTDDEVQAVRAANGPVFTLSGPRGAQPPWEDQS